MDRGDKIVKILTILNYINATLFGVLSQWIYGLMTDVWRLVGMIAICGTIAVILVRMPVEEEKDVRTFVLTATVASTGLAFFNAYVANWPYIFVMFQLILLICNIAGLRKYVFVVMMFADCSIVLFMTIFLKMFRYAECSVVITTFLISCWVAFIFSNRMGRVTQMVSVQNQSRDDMFALVESRFAEEKGANTAKSAFLANMSHEIRTPINAILGLNTMTLRECDDPQIREYAMEIEQAGQTLLALINDILDISKVESGKMEIVPVEYDLSSVINDTVNMMSLKAKAKDLDLRVEIDSTLPHKLYGDDVRIRQILVNLLSNAVKYTERGSVVLKVSGEIKDDIVKLSYSISDTGIGIREEDMQRLFDKYERLDTVKNRNVEGTGLGMAITNRLLQLMNSRLKVESTYGKGSTFSFDLDQKIIDKEPIGDFTKRFNNIKTDDDSDARFIAPDAKILVVDDNRTNRLVFSKLLQRIKVQVDEADSGKACLAMCCEKEYDIIFLDHMMPEMDGLETREKMRENTRCPNIDTPVIALTANAISGSREFYLEAGFDDYISKPVDPKKLERMIYDLLPEEKKEIFSGGE
ncbi:MAG: response regulator [Lachnospiraceae bacterium]|nr:response regulator [Lachnospiraceae bacterium]